MNDIRYWHKILLIERRAILPAGQESSLSTATRVRRNAG